MFRLGLERVSVVWQRLGIKPPAGGVISVAGTNGKGSCALFCEALLRASGRRVGTTLSPHLHRFNERIRVDGIETSDAEICESLDAVEQARSDVHLSYFEHAILAALWRFDASNTDTWVLEVGLGGRLDAVNIVDADVAIISSIGLEHTEWLGHTREAIGAEKAGILRPLRPLVCGSSEMPRSIFERADALGCPVYLPGRDFRQAHAGTFRFEARLPRGRAHLESTAMPRVALENAVAATMACLLLTDAATDPDTGLTDSVADPAQMQSEALQFACEQAVNPGRLENFEWNGMRVVLDLAHNPDAARFLRRQLDAELASARTRAICGFLADKDVAGTVRELAGVIDHWMFVSTPGDRGRTAQASLKLARGELKCATLEAHDSVEAAIQAMKGVSCAPDRLLVFGSFATVGKARRFLHAHQARPS